MASGWREPTDVLFYRPVHTGSIAKLVSYFFAAAEGTTNRSVPVIDCF
jgi:hypothetical protein